MEEHHKYQAGRILAVHFGGTRMSSRRTHTFRVVILCVALATCNFALNGKASAALADLGEAQRFLFLAQKGISEGGSINRYIGDIAAPSMYSWNPFSFDGTIVDNEPIIAEAIADALEFSTLLATLQPDATFSVDPPREWHTVKSGLNVLNVLDYPDAYCSLPQTIFGDEGDTVVVNR